MMADSFVIPNPHIVVVEGATRDHLLWLVRERPRAVFNYRVLNTDATTP